MRIRLAAMLVLVAARPGAVLTDDALARPPNIVLIVELLDLEADPGESADVSADHPEVVERARRIMAESHTPSGLFPLRQVDMPSVD